MDPIFLVVCLCLIVGVRDEKINEQTGPIFPSKRTHKALNPFMGKNNFLSLFTYVQFENGECLASNGDRGTCLTASECSRKAGEASGNCASGYGTCCLFRTSCGGTIQENGTYFVNDGYPDSFDETGSCQVTLMRNNNDICQYRLNFERLDIMGPEDRNHLCDTDQFMVSGSSTTVPPICGNNDGNHVYIDAGVGTNTVTLSVVTSGGSFQRNFKIRVLQIPCNSLTKAEDGCLQYFTGISGQIYSFNYDPNNGRQLSNQDYSICIRPERNLCGIQYTQCTDTAPPNNRSRSFTLSGNSNQAVPAMVGSVGGSNYCQADYIVVAMATNVGRPITGPYASVDRMCGGVLSADITLQPTTIRSNVKPFRIFYHTDGVETPVDVNNRGFCLNYIQQPCTGYL